MHDSKFEDKAQLNLVPKDAFKDSIPFSSQSSLLAEKLVKQAHKTSLHAWSHIDYGQDSGEILDSWTPQADETRTQILLEI